ncbi:MAG: hypothetical protein ACOVP1_05700 [Bacteroidia bacterium]
MKTITILSSERMLENSELSLKSRISFQILKGSKEIMNFAKYLYVVSVMVLLLCAVIELKHIFQVDIFPGIDTPFDNAYYAGKEQMGGSVL